MKMKKVICLLLVLLMMLSGTVFTFAADETEDAMISEDGEISLRSGGSGRLTVPVYYQPQNSNQCGPTSCRMILACFGVNKSLSAIVNEMANMANHDYTHIDSATTMLNRYIPGNHFKKYTLGSSTTAFPNHLMESIDAGYPVLCHLETSALPAYNGAQYYHYVVATGYLWGQGGSSGGTNFVYYNNPHYDSRFGGAKQCNWLDMQTAINNFYGLIVRGE